MAAPVQRIPVEHQMMKFLITQLTSPRSFYNNISSPKPRPYTNYLCFGVNLKNSRKELCGKVEGPGPPEQDGETGAGTHKCYWPPDTAGVPIKKLMKITSSYMYSRELYSTEKRPWLCCRTQQEQILTQISSKHCSCLQNYSNGLVINIKPSFESIRDKAQHSWKQIKS